MIKLAGGVLAITLLTAATTTQDTYGAIYFSQDTGVYGYSWNHVTQADAEDAAYRECRESARDCERASWFRNACGALAIADNNGWGSSWGNTIAEAERQSLAKCREYDNTNCRIEISFCSSR
jgi:serine/threonine-protein kinase